MPNPYDTAFRERVVVAYEAGRGSYRELAAMFGLGPRTVERWVARWRALRRAGYVLKKNGRGRVRSTARTSARNGRPL